jgi:hypothetical protein
MTDPFDLSYTNRTKPVPSSSHYGYSHSHIPTQSTRTRLLQSPQNPCTLRTCSASPMRMSRLRSVLPRDRTALWAGRYSRVLSRSSSRLVCTCSASDSAAVPTKAVPTYGCSALLTPVDRTGNASSYGLDGASAWKCLCSSWSLIDA